MLTIYILVTCEDQAAIDQLADDLKQEFDEITREDEHDISYLGMHLERDGTDIILSMQAYLSNILDELGVNKSVTTPANENLFKVSDTDTRLSEKERQQFHTTVAKLLYLSKRTRPDILLPISFLCTRVKEATVSDQLKLDRVLKYLNGTRGMDTRIGQQQELTVRGFIDAGFASHRDSRSHSGLVVQVGRTTVLCKSSKQKLVSKDSTEAELVALSDMKDEVLKCWEFMTEQGHNLPEPTLYQDNQSTIALVKTGGGKYRNKYMRVRRERMQESLENGEVNIEYVSTKKMLADIFTKPLQGQLFFRMASGLLGSAEKQDATGVR